MQTVFSPGLVTGIFIRELKNRFLCEVDINGESTVCYVPSSCHLGNFIALEGKQVFLQPTQSKNARTPYALFAVAHKHSLILLNTSLSNKIIKDSLGSRRFSYLGPRKNISKEHYVGNYKSDLFIEDTNTIIEIKSVLSISRTASFPTVFSERSLRQLDELKYLLTIGFRVHYIIVSLNPYVTTIEINTETQFAEKFKECMDIGMTVSAFSCKLKDKVILINQKLMIKV